MAWLRAALILATTLAASRVHPVNTRQSQEACGSFGFTASCKPIDAMVRSDHVVYPLAGAAALLVFTHAPTLFLSSRNRMRELWAGVWQIHGLAAALLASSWLFLFQSRALSYAMSVHFSALYLSLAKPPTRLLSALTYRGVQVAAWLGLLAYVWFAGPPLPVWDAPGIPACCGAVAHVAAWIAAESLGAAVVGWEQWWRNLE